jgi:hypothetical protein
MSFGTTLEWETRSKELERARQDTARAQAERIVADAKRRSDSLRKARVVTTPGKRWLPK